MVATIDSIEEPPPGDIKITVPIHRARGVGGQQLNRPLYETDIDGEIFVIWDLDDGRVACVPAHCPHRPALGAVLHIRGVVEGSNIRCTRHANLYSGSDGHCLAAEGSGEPGELKVRFGVRVGDRVELVVGQPSPRCSVS